MLTDQRTVIQNLVNRYQNLRETDKRHYNEANTVNAFIRPLFEALGWDFSNIDEVEAEKTVVRGRADYVFKVKRVSKFCVEVKALRHELTEQDREQAISYAYNKGVTWAILTNFVRTQVFNSEIKGDLRSARFLDLHCTDYVAEFEDLLLLSKEAALNDELDKKAERYGKLARRIPVERKLYEQLTRWRTDVFNEVYGFNREKGITLDQADQLVERLFSRLIFIRTAEDRGLANNHPLLAALRQWERGGGSLLEKVKSIFQDFVLTFDSDIFPMMDPWRQIWINDHTLAAVIKGLYEVPGDYAKYYFNVIEPDVLGQVYEQYLGYVAKIAKPEIQSQQSFIVPDEHIEISAKKEKRKKGGIYYTPKWVTDYIVRETLGRYLREHTYSEILNLKILDPACGSGSFLIRAYDELLSYHAKVQGKSQIELNWSERVRILTGNIFGVDLDPQAVEIARLNLLIRALSQREPLPPLEQNIQCGNSLIFGTEHELAKSLGSNFRELRPFNWEERFPDIMRTGGFDIVIGNPPYVMELRDNKEMFRQIKATPFGAKYYEPKMDLFYYFIELGIDLLRPGGYLGFIVEQYWVSRKHASKLRRKIFEETTPLILVDLGEYQVFHDAPGQHNMIVILQKKRDARSKTLLLRLKDSNISEQAIIKALAMDASQQEIFDADVIDTSKLYDASRDKVYVVKDVASRILAKLSRYSFYLDATEIQQGLVTPQHFLSTASISRLPSAEAHKAGEGIFVLSKAEASRLRLTANEKKLLRPFHYAEELDSYLYKPDVKYYLIYTPVEIAKDIECNPAKYPNIRAHLDKYQSVITSDHKPYGLHRARQPEWFEDPEKIVCVRKTTYPKVAVVPEPWYADQAVLIIRLTKHKKFSPYYITAILNSKVAHFWLYHQKRQGDQLQVDKEVLLHFPFPKLDLSNQADKRVHNRLAALARKISAQKKQLESLKNGSVDLFGERARELKATVQKLKDEIDEQVFKLYRLSPTEIQQIQNAIGQC